MESVVLGILKESAVGLVLGLVIIRLWNEFRKDVREWQTRYLEEHEKRVADLKESRQDAADYVSALEKAREKFSHPHRNS